MDSDSKFSGESLQDVVISPFPNVSFTWSFGGELGPSNPREPPSLFIQSVSLSVIHEVPSLFCFSLGDLFSSVCPPYSRRLVPSPVEPYFKLLAFWESSATAKKGDVLSRIFFLLLLSSVEYFNSNIYQLRRVHSQCTIWFLQLSPDVWGVLPTKIKSTILIFLGASGLALVWCL